MIINVRRQKDDPAAKDHAAGGAGATGPLGAGTIPVVDYVGLVDWERMDHDKFVDRFNWKQTPSTLAIVLGQEDLWVCEAVLRVIQKCNENATKDKPSTAVVKRIEHLDIGQDAARAWLESDRMGGLGGQRGSGLPGQFGPPGAMPAGGGGQPAATPPAGGPPLAPGMGPSMIGQVGSTGGLTDAQLLNFRYVDNKGVPLPYDAGRTYYVAHPFAEFKLMPIRLSVVMDQRWIPKLLVKCANSNMPIEVRRVRVATAEATTAMGGTTGMPAPGIGSHAPSGGGQSEDVGPLDAPVEIQASIYIYNPPDRERLGKGAAASLPTNLGPSPAAPANPSPTPTVTPPPAPRN